MIDELQSAAITLRAHAAPLTLPDRRVFGIWDPLLRRIDLYGVDATRSNRDIVRTLLHELAHAVWHQHAEDAAREFTEGRLAAMSETEIASLAAALRALASPIEAERGHSARASWIPNCSGGQNARTPLLPMTLALS